MTLGHWTLLNLSNKLSFNLCILALIVILPQLSLQSVHVQYGCKPCQSARSNPCVTPCLPLCLHAFVVYIIHCLTKELSPTENPLLLSLPTSECSWDVSWPSDLSAQELFLFLSPAHIFILNAGVSNYVLWYGPVFVKLQYWKYYVELTFWHKSQQNI